MDGEAQFCPECGEALGEGTQTQQKQSPPSQAGQQPAQTPSQQTTQSGRLSWKGWAYISIGCSVIALMLFPPVFGIAGIFSGYQVHKRGREGQGIVLMIVAGIALIAGMLIGAYVFTS